MKKLMLYSAAITLGVLLAVYTQRTPEIQHLDSWQIISAFLS
jgi:hypothetical protein